MLDVPKMKAHIETVSEILFLSHAVSQWLPNQSVRLHIRQTKGAGRIAKFGLLFSVVRMLMISEIPMRRHVNRLCCDRSPNVCCSNPSRPDRSFKKVETGESP